jgi:hypothetical protein
MFRKKNCCIRSMSLCESSVSLYVVSAAVVVAVVVGAEVVGVVGIVGAKVAGVMGTKVAGVVEKLRATGIGMFSIAYNFPKN